MANFFRTGWSLLNYNEKVRKLLEKYSVSLTVQEFYDLVVLRNENNDYSYEDIYSVSHQIEIIERMSCYDFSCLGENQQSTIANILTKLQTRVQLKQLRDMRKKRSI